MSTDFWAGYLSGAIGIIIGNPLDVVKVRLQAGPEHSPAPARNLAAQFETTSSLVKGAAAPILGYGALNALLFVSYNRTLKALDQSIINPANPVGVPLHKIWLAGAVGGLASWVISSPTELVKCRAQLDPSRSTSSWEITKVILKKKGLRGLYFGGAVTSIRDSVGYGFYFWSYELCKRLMSSEDESSQETATKILLCGGIAGIVTWASVFPLDVIKTRLQAQSFSTSNLPSASSPERQSLLRQTIGQSISHSTQSRLLNSVEIARNAYHSEGLGVFYRGIGVCSLRAFIVNAVQWATYEWIMRVLNNPKGINTGLENVV